MFPVIGGILDGGDFWENSRDIRIHGYFPKNTTACPLTGFELLPTLRKPPGVKKHPRGRPAASDVSPVLLNPAGASHTASCGHKTQTQARRVTCLRFVVAPAGFIYSYKPSGKCAFCTN